MSPDINAGKHQNGSIPVWVFKKSWEWLCGIYPERLPTVFPKKVCRFGSTTEAHSVETGPESVHMGSQSTPVRAETKAQNEARPTPSARTSRHRMGIQATKPRKGPKKLTFFWKHGW